MKKTPYALAAGLIAAALALTACGGPATPSPSSATSAPATSAPPSETYKIAITIFVTHTSLNAISDGFKEQLAAKGVQATFVEDNAQAEIPNTTTIAGKYASDPSIQLVLAIATPSAQAVVNAIQDRPILYAGVTDPVSANLVKSWEPSGINVAGTSDLNPEGYPLGLILDILGKDKVKKVGFPYTLTEKNSIVQLELLQKEAEGTGVEIVPAGIANSSDLTQGLESLKSKGVDAIHIGTDNTIVSSMDTVVGFTQQNKIPLFSSDVDSVNAGTIAARGIDYYKLGQQTGDMAYEILVNGKNVGEIPQLQVTETEILYNLKAAETYGVTLPQAIIDAGKAVG